MAKTTYVDLATGYGDIVIALYDDAAPLTVQNFLRYAGAAAGSGYLGSFFHRLVPGFILQGGGFTDAGGTIAAIPAGPAVANEFSAARSNLAGTVAMAKLGGDPNSATNQFFFNLGDNSANLDAQNGGFTVFGQVTADTYGNVQRIAALPTGSAGAAFGGALTAVPVQVTPATNAATPVDVRDVTITAAPPPTGAFAFTDTAASVSATTAGEAYAGPVVGLARQFIWPSTHNAAIAATVANVFLHGGSGDDALNVSAGTNVLDGGTGSNFLVGGTGADGGTDTFFVDGRGGGVTWSTVVNFHHGDAVTVFGFTDASTRPWTALDGAGGYQGATIHSELGGAGTGVNGSVTFAGISLADAQARFSILQGVVGNTPYLYVAYTG